MFTEKILLYAGNSCISSPLVLIAFGTIYLLIFIAGFCPATFNFTGQSAGNFSFAKSTDISINTYNKHINLPKISEHVSKHKTNLTDQEFGYFLTGLIEGKGCFDENELHINFSKKDASLAYFIKKKIGYGTVKTIKHKAKMEISKSGQDSLTYLRYICNNTNGLSKILFLTNGKYIGDSKYEELIKHNYSYKFNFVISSPTNKLSLDNYWLAGFTQVRGFFKIPFEKNTQGKEITGFSVNLLYSLEHNDDLPLKLLYNIFNTGNVSKKSTALWCYNSTSFITALNLINYFDKFNLFADKYKDFLKFRKVYILISEGKHLEETGKKRIISIATKGSSETSTQEI